MPIVSAAEFSRMARVSKVAVSKAPPTTVFKNSDGKIDTDHPVNAVYLARHTGRAELVSAPVPKPKRQGPKKPDPEDLAFQKEVRTGQVKKAAKDQIATTDSEDLSPAERKAVAKTIADLMGDTVNLDREKKVADIALKKVLEKNHAFKLAKSKGEVITREEFRRIAEGWNASLGQNVMRVPRRVMSRLWAMAKAGDDARAGELMLERELSKAVGRALEGVAGA